MITKSKVGVFKPKTYVVELSVTEPKSIHEAMTIPSWQKAVDEELQALIKNDTCDLVPAPAHHNLVGCKWLFKIKRNHNDSVPRNKAQLVARGFSQTSGLDYYESFSLVVKENTIRMVLAMVIIVV